MSCLKLKTQFILPTVTSEVWLQAQMFEVRASTWTSGICQLMTLTFAATVKTFCTKWRRSFFPNIRWTLSEVDNCCRQVVEIVVQTTKVFSLKMSLLVHASHFQDSVTFRGPFGLSTIVHSHKVQRNASNTPPQLSLQILQALTLKVTIVLWAPVLSFIKVIR